MDVYRQIAWKPGVSRKFCIDIAVAGHPIRRQIVRPEALTFHDSAREALARIRGGGARNAEGSNVCPGSFLGRRQGMGGICKKPRRQGCRTTCYLINAVSLGCAFFFLSHHFQDTLSSYRPSSLPRSYKYTFPVSTPQKGLLLLTIKNKPLQHHFIKITTTAPSTVATTTKMTDTMPLPTQHSSIPRNDSFSAEDLTKALKASAKKSSKTQAFAALQQDHSAVPPPSPHQSRPVSRRTSFYGSRR